jgi:hypothetical protein
MGLPTIRADLAQHVIYGYGAAALACAGVALGALVLDMPSLRLAMPGAAVAGGLAAGLAKEAADWWANRLARRRFEEDWLRWLESLGEEGAPDPDAWLDRPPPLPHEVSLDDLVATILGALPCAVVALLGWWP